MFAGDPSAAAPERAVAKVSRILASRNDVLERIATGAPLADVLTLLTTGCEEYSPGTLCSVLLLDKATKRLRHGAAPTLPQFYCDAVDGIAIGPSNGSCGAAAYRCERVIVEDIQAHPYWTAYADVANAAGLRACWSEPIFSSKDEVLGTFAMYYREPRKPDAPDIEFIRTSAHVAGVAIERARSEEELEKHRHHLEELVYQRTAELAARNEELHRALKQVKVLRGLLPICASCKRVRADKGYWAQIEHYLVQHSDAVVTHGICPECAPSVLTPRKR